MLTDVATPTGWQTYEKVSANLRISAGETTKIGWRNYEPYSFRMVEMLERHVRAIGEQYLAAFPIVVIEGRVR